jgi:hypothetical protein
MTTQGVVVVAKRSKQSKNKKKRKLGQKHEKYKFD